MLADRGHEIHLISAKLPFRWRGGTPGCPSSTWTVPQLSAVPEPQYLLALTNTIVRVAREQRLDIVHAHYAVPHATAAYLADQMLTPGPGHACRARSPRCTAPTSRWSAAIRRTPRRRFLDRAVARCDERVRESEARTRFGRSMSAAISKSFPTSSTRKNTAAKPTRRCDTGCAHPRRVTR